MQYFHYFYTKSITISDYLNLLIANYSCKTIKGDLGCESTKGVGLMTSSEKKSKNFFSKICFDLIRVNMQRKFFPFFGSNFFHTQSWRIPHTTTTTTDTHTHTDTHSPPMHTFHPLLPTHIHTHIQRHTYADKLTHTYLLCHKVWHMWHMFFVWHMCDIIF